MHFLCSASVLAPSPTAAPLLPATWTCWLPVLRWASFFSATPPFKCSAWKIWGRKVCAASFLLLCCDAGGNVETSTKQQVTYSVFAASLQCTVCSAPPPPCASAGVHIIPVHTIPVQTSCITPVHNIPTRTPLCIYHPCPQQPCARHPAARSSRNTPVHNCHTHTHTHTHIHCTVTGPIA